MNIVHTISSIEYVIGGPALSVRGNVNYQAKRWKGGVAICTANPCNPFGLDENVFYNPDVSFYDYLSFNNVDIVHDHGLWLSHNRMVANVSIKKNLKRIVSPRGMLEPWALNHKKWKKKIAWLVYQQRFLKTAACLHATAISEAKQIRKLGLENPIAVIPNGVEMPELIEDERLNVKDRNGNSKKTILFLSRIQRKKGILNLVRAWAEVQDPDWRIRIVGPVEDNHLEEVKAEAKRLGVYENISFEDPIYGDEKWGTYASVDLFVLPTFSENFGIVIGEALASGTPVITTTGTPWEELNTHNCGWWIDIGVEPLVQALKDAMSRSDQERIEMGKRGRALIESKYTWPKVAEQMLEVYQWILGKGEKPDYVRLD